MILTDLATLLILFFSTLSDVLMNFFKIFMMLHKKLTDLLCSSLESALFKAFSNLSISLYPKFTLSSSFYFSASGLCPSFSKIFLFKEFFGINSSLSKSFSFHRFLPNTYGLGSGNIYIF